jgi:hypothetical protein
LIELAELSYKISRPFAAPPDVPAERAKALQLAFMAVQGDPQYRDEATKLRLEISAIGDREVLDVIDRIAAAPPNAALGGASEPTTAETRPIHWEQPRFGPAWANLSLKWLT